MAHPTSIVTCSGGNYLDRPLAPARGQRYWFRDDDALHVSPRSVVVARVPRFTDATMAQAVGISL